MNWRMWLIIALIVVSQVAADCNDNAGICGYPNGGPYTCVGDGR